MARFDHGNLLHLKNSSAPVENRNHIPTHKNVLSKFTAHNMRFKFANLWIKKHSWCTQIDITNVIDFSKARFEPANLWVKRLGSWCSQIDIYCMIDFWKLESRGSELHTFLLQHTCIESRQNLARLGETWTHTPSKPPDSCMKWRQRQTLESNTHTFQISHMLTESHKTF